MSKGFELQPPSLRRWLTDWFRARWRELRGQGPVPLEWDQPLETAPFFLDSLEILSLASHAADDFCVRDSGIEDYFLARRTLTEWQELIRESWARSADPSVSFSTSGSTGTPIHQRHRLALLDQEIEAFHAVLPPSPTIRKSVPGHHIYGFLFTVLLADRRGSRVVELEPESPRVEPGDLLVTHPVHLNLWKQRALVTGPRATPRLPCCLTGPSTPKPTILGSAARGSPPPSNCPTTSNGCPKPISAPGAAERLETGARPQRYTFGPRLPEKLPGQPAAW